MAEFSIADIRAGGNPQRAYEWEVKIMGVPNAVGWDSSIQELLVQRAQSVNIPEDSLETVTVDYRSSKVTFFGRDSSPQTMTVTFWENEGEGTREWFTRWRNKMRSSATGEGVSGSENYKAILMVRKFFTNGDTSDSNAFYMAFPTSVGQQSLDYSSSDKATFDVTFSYAEQLSPEMYGDFGIQA